jgi:cobalt/nickel transport system permease protein
LRAPDGAVPFHLPDGSYRTRPQEVAVHVPDGFIDAPVSLGAGVVAAAAIGVALRGSRRELGDERVAPLAGLVAAFVFAVQMLNFPVAAGTSGHLLGGALAAVLVGPWTGLLCVSVVLLVQLFFADGGLTAYGVNVTCMAVTTALVGWLVFRLLLRLLPRTTASVVPASFAAALVSVPASALAFTGVYALGGTVEIPLGTLAGAMVGVHVLIGIGEAVITALVVSSVLTVRPDLVYGARALVAARRAEAVAA